MKAKISAGCFLGPLVTSILMIVLTSLLFDFIGIRGDFIYCCYGFSIIFFIIELVLTVIRLIKVHFIRLEFNDKTVIGSVGMLNVRSLESPIDKINDIEIKQNLYGLILGYGTLIIHTSSNKYNFDYIVKPKEFRKELMNKINK